jgi:type I restriction enzyme S subunit
MNRIFEFFDIRTADSDLSAVLLSDFRLDSSFFINESQIKFNSQINFKLLSELATVFFPGIFKRFLVENPKYGIGFLTTSEMMMVEPKAEKLLSTDLTTNLEIYRVEENSLLVSRSGSVGNTIFVYEDLIRYAITEDALRVKPFDKKYLGLLYFYFTSYYGKSLITGQQSGAVIDHIYEENLLNLSIPILDEETNEYFYGIFIKVRENREKANKLLRKARTLVLEYNNLPPLEEAELETLDPDKETDLRFVSTKEFTDDFRLDAHFYNPMAELAVRNIREKADTYYQLIELVNEIILGKRFKRNYVESDHGTPFLSGKNIIQIRPEVKYLSNSEIKFMDDLLIEKNWTLVTCSGTIGRTCFVYNNYEGYAASQHILRVNPDESEIDPGYLYCFLSTDYGYHQILRYRYGAVIDEIDDNNMAEILVPICEENQQKEIGDLVRQAYDLRAEAIRLEDEAQEILTKALTGK